MRGDGDSYEGGWVGGSSGVVTDPSGCNLRHKLRHKLRHQILHKLRHNIRHKLLHKLRHKICHKIHHRIRHKIRHKIRQLGTSTWYEHFIAMDPWAMGRSPKGPMGPKGPWALRGAWVPERGPPGPLARRPSGPFGALWGSAHGPRIHGYEVFVPS